MKPRKPFLWLTALVLFVAIACSLGAPATAPIPTATQAQTSKNTIEPTKASTPTSAQAPSTQASPGAVTSLDDLQKATIQIESQGTFINPQVGLMVNAAGLGSGFIIDPSGIAVTNNHVVTGAALLKVWVGGDLKKTYNARVLGVSECSDLAVIKIDGNNFPFLQWYNNPIKVGLQVYAAGFPLGDPNFTLTRGIVSKENANGNTSWASVKSVIEHDATINPGNSGGPLVDDKGQVVGINYAGASSTRQYFAINGIDAQPLIEQLKIGKNVDTIGVNGEAVASSDGTLTGIWVSSVASGSPADKAGVKPGDIITSMENLVLATNGTMSDYCNILRSHNSGDTLSITVLRFATQEVLRGDLNGRELTVAGTFGQPGNSGEATTTPGANGSDYSSYVVVKDNTNTIEVEVPAEWKEIDGSQWQDNNQNIGVTISAAADLKKFYNTWSESGVFFGASDRLAQLGGYIQILDATRSSFTQCKLIERKDYSDGTYKGKYDAYDNCGGQGGSSLLVLSLVPNDNSQAYAILIEIKVIQNADLEALKRIIKSFKVIGNF